MTRTGGVLFVFVAVLLGLFLRVLPFADTSIAPSATTFGGADAAQPAALKPVTERSVVDRVSRLLAEALLVACALLIMLSSTAFAGPLAQTSRGLRRLVLVVIGLFTVGLLGGQSRVTFPLMPWRMYSGVPVEPPFIIRIVGTTTDGGIVEIKLDRALPVLAPRRLGHLVRQQIASLQATAEPTLHASLWEAHVRTLQGIAQLHTRRDKGDEFRNISVYGGRVPNEAIASFPDSLPLLWQVPL